MKNFVSAHVHQGSLDTAASPSAFAEREIELGTGYLVTTDHGTLQATRKVYDLAKEKKLKPILGLEGYVRDDDCPILTAAGVAKDEKKTFAEYAKYFHVTLHAIDQEAFETLVKVLSRTDLNRKEKHGQESKPLFTWADLEELGAKNVTMTSSCLAGMVQRHLVDHSNTDMAVAYYEKLRGLCKPGNFYTEVFPHVCDTYWQSSCIVTWIDGTEEKFVPWKKFKTEKHGDAQVQELAKKLKGKVFTPSEAPVLVAVMENRKWVECAPRKILRVEIREGFLKNECQPWCPDGDLQAGCNKFLLYMAEQYGDTIIIGDDSHFAKPDEKIVQDIRLQSGGGSWRFAGSYHRQDSAEAMAYFQARVGVDAATFEKWVENSYVWAKRFDQFELKTRKSLPTSFYPADTFGHTMALIEKQGRMDWNNQAWVERLEAEIKLLHQNGTIDLLPYFMIDQEVCDLYDEHRELPGPGRGSAAGVLLTYLLGITHVEPLRYKLSLERFLTASRIRSGKLPDIDQDLPHRDLLTDPETGWLKKRFGECFAQISVDTSLKLRSSVKDVARVIHGRVPDDIEKLTKDFENAPQGVEDMDFIFGYSGSDKSWVKGSIESDAALMEYIKKYPAEWAIVQKCLGLTRQKSRHACGYVIADTPISDFIPMTTVGGVSVTAYTPKSVEAMGGLKMDFLVVNSLNDIRDCIQMIQDRRGGRIMEAMKIDGKRVPGHRIVPLPDSYKPPNADEASFASGQDPNYDPSEDYADIWDLPEDQDVFRDFCEGKTETVFQFNTPGMLGWLPEFDHVKCTDSDGKTRKALDSIEALAALTALDRPGPLDFFVEAADGTKHNMLVEYARRARGDNPTGNLPILDQLLPDTYGVIVYQEQLQRIFQHVGGTSAEEADDFRVHISKKQAMKVMQDRVVFDKGAIPMLGEDQAKQLWDSMETFANYGFNKSVAGDTILDFRGGSKALKEFVGGEVVESVDENGNIVEDVVVALHDHGTIPGFAIEFDDGYCVTVSANHKFLTSEGQKPLHELVTRNLGVLCRSVHNDKDSTLASSTEMFDLLSGHAQKRSTAQELDRTVRRDFRDPRSVVDSQENLPTVSRDKKGQCKGQDEQTQHLSGTEARCLQSRNQNLRSTGHSTPESSKARSLAEGSSGGNLGDLGESSSFSEAVKNGGLVEVLRGTYLAGGAGQVRGGAQADRLRLSGRTDLGGSRRLLPLLRTVEDKAQPSLRARQGCDAKSGSTETECNIDPAVRRMLSEFGRQDARRLAPVAYSDAPLSSIGSLVLRRIVRVRFVGFKHMYDLEVSHSKHNYLLPNGVVTSNSHAVCYVIISYACAYLKHHYPLEWWTSVLRNADKSEINETFWRYCGHLIDLPDLNLSEDRFEIRNERIRAPVTLLLGIGEKAHQQLCAGRPYASILDFCQKNEAFKKAGTTQVLGDDGKPVMVVDKKTQQLVPKTRAGHSALNKTVVGTLIVSGAMNSLFPPNTDTVDQLGMYFKAAADAANKKKIEPVPGKYLLLDALIRFQMRKAVLPAYAESLLQHFEHRKIECFHPETVNNRACFFHGGTTYPFASMHEIECIAARKPWPESFSVAVAGAAYIVSERKFKYGQNNQAIEYVLDIDGGRMKVVRWPDRNSQDKSKLPMKYRDDLTGSVVVALLRKYREDRPFALDDLEIVQEPLGTEKEEE